MREVRSMGTDRIRRNKRIITGITAVLVMIIVCLAVSSVVLANSKKEENIYKYYTSIEIKPGDTLWSIADEYCHDMNLSVQDYIKEVKRLNHLSSDSITSGQYLTVMYVSSEYKE